MSAAQRVDRNALGVAEVPVGSFQRGVAQLYLQPGGTDVRAGLDHAQRLVEVVLGGRKVARGNQRLGDSEVDERACSDLLRAPILEILPAEVQIDGVLEAPVDLGDAGEVMVGGGDPASDRGVVGLRRERACLREQATCQFDVLE